MSFMGFVALIMEKNVLESPTFSTARPISFRTQFSQEYSDRYFHHYPNSKEGNTTEPTPKLLSAFPLSIQ